MKGVKPVIGWREWVSLPDLGIQRIKVKVDTGARSSALHAFCVETEEREDGLWVKFEVHPQQRAKKQLVKCEARVIDHRIVRDSGGRQNERFVIETTARLGEREWPIEVTLTARDAMGFRMLLGRTAIRGRFVVDSGRSYLMGKRND